MEQSTSGRFASGQQSMYRRLEPPLEYYEETMDSGTTIMKE